MRLMKEFVNWLVMWQVGKRQAFERTDFGYKVTVKEESQSVSIDGKGRINGKGEIDSNENEADQNDGNVRVQVDKAYIKALQRRYYMIIIAEPILLVIGISAAVGCTVWSWKIF